MTRRDRFALGVLQALVSAVAFNRCAEERLAQMGLTADETPKFLVEMAYGFADRVEEQR